MESHRVLNNRDLLTLIGQFVCTDTTDRRSFVSISKLWRKVWYENILPSFDMLKVISPAIVHFIRNLYSKPFSFTINKLPIIWEILGTKIATEFCIFASRKTVVERFRFFSVVWFNKLPIATNFWPWSIMAAGCYPKLDNVLKCLEQNQSPLDSKVQLYRQMIFGCLCARDHPPLNLSLILKEYYKLGKITPEYLKNLIQEMVKYRYPHVDCVLPYINTLDLMVDYINTFYVYTASISKFLSKYYTMITIDEYVRVFESRIGPLRLIPDKNEFIAEYIKVGLQHPEFISRTICNGSAIVIRSLITQDILNILSPTRYTIKISGRKIDVSLVELSVFPGYSPLFSLLQETAGFNVSDHLGVIKFAMLKNCGYEWLMEHDSLNNVNTRLELRETLKEWATLPEFKKSYNSKRINKCIRTNNEKLGEIVPYKKAKVDFDQDE